MKLETTNRVIPLQCEPAIQLHDVASIELAPDEMVTFTTPGGGEYDVCRKDWGFFATPSLNGRLLGYGLHAVLCKSAEGKYMVMLVETEKKLPFHEYIDRYGYAIVTWLDSDESLGQVADAINPAPLF